MNGADVTHQGYTDMADLSLREFALSDAEPIGDYWDLLCDIAGVDPENFADCVRYARRKRAEANLAA